MFKIRCIFAMLSKEEASSAGEQLASNRVANGNIFPKIAAYFVSGF